MLPYNEMQVDTRPRDPWPVPCLKPQTKASVCHKYISTRKNIEKLMSKMIVLCRSTMIVLDRSTGTILIESIILVDPL